MKKQPAVTARTKKKIVDTFWQIAKTKPLKKITVREITSNASLNRGTYYEYFADINDLIAYAEEEIFIDFQHNTKEIFQTDKKVDIRNFSNQLVRLFTCHDYRLFLLLGVSGDPDFVARIKTELTQYLFPFIKSTPLEPYASYLIAYTTSATTGLLLHWHEQNKELSANELAEIIYHLSTQGLFNWTGIMDHTSVEGTSDGK